VIRGLVHGSDTLEELALRGLDSDAVVAVLELFLPSLETKNRTLRELDFLGPDLADDVWPRMSSRVEITHRRCSSL
jgi:hypothetical protein